MAKLVEDAAHLAEQLVSPLGRRWAHVQAVARRALELTDAVEPEQADTLVAAAWLHDIGYAPEIALTKFHPLDGARHLKHLGWPREIVNLVAHHSGARFEAAERALAAELGEFPFEDSPILDALVTADLTTGPDGEHLSYNDRIAEILERYPINDPVHRTWLKAGPILKESVQRTERRLTESQPK